MQTQHKTLAIAVAGLAVAAALGMSGATLASAADETAASSSSGVGGHGQLPGEGVQGASGADHGRGMRDPGGALTADAASKAVAAATAELDGGTVNSVRALSDGTYVVDATTSDGTRVHVLLDKAFAVTSTEEGGPGKGGGRGMPDGAGDAPESGPLPGPGTGSSSDPSDANGTSTTSRPTT